MKEKSLTLTANAGKVEFTISTAVNPNYKPIRAVSFPVESEKIIIDV